MMNPHGSGSSACVSRAVPEHLKQAIERMILKNGWRGLFMVELLQDHSGQYWFIEFNGRPWGSMALSRRQGLEYPAWNARLALTPGFSVQTPALNGSELVCRNLGRELVHLLFVLRGSKSGAIKTWPSFWRSVVDVLLIRRNDYFYNFRRDDLVVFFSDCFCTIRDQVFKWPKREQKA
jgi:predicted ATP-grasp superfamily ATP-dependent carboligase